MAKKTVTNSRRDQFQQACQELRTALDKQSKDATSPSINVEQAIARIMVFDSNWTRNVLGPFVANALIKYKPEETS